MEALTMWMTIGLILILAIVGGCWLVVEGNRMTKETWNRLDNH